jgi:trehalose synthase
VLHYIDVGAQRVDAYQELADNATLEELRRLGRELRGAHVLQVNATPYGGGVSELLRSVVPLERDLGLRVDWAVITAEPGFYAFTKRLHNGLQGASFSVSEHERELYWRYNREAAEGLRDAYDFIIIHDPQPAAMRAAARTTARWVWRAHIDMSHYNRNAWGFLRPFVLEYDRHVFTMPQFVPDGLSSDTVVIIAPAIDPLSPKNMSLPDDLMRRIVEWNGVSAERPLLTQVSRFDPWKDPLGVIDIYRRLKQRHPALQLALVGSMALDDPEAWGLYAKLVEAAGDDMDIHILTNFTGVGNVDVNAFQRCSSVVIQKSIREGFGLVISETLWKGTPVVAGRTGGIPLQMPDGTGGFLVDADDWVDRIDELLRERERARELAELGRQRVRERFLITRLVHDELAVLASLAG